MQSLSLTPQRIRNRQRLEDTSDADSTRSFGSNASIASACDHASFALNGTTWSGRSHRYIVHCSSSAHLPDAEEYLTPTQRAARQTRQLQASLREARRLADEREREVLRLTQELVELRMVKASAPASPERSSSSSGPEAPSVRELVAASCAGPGLVDSGHFDDGSEHSKESLRLESRGREHAPDGEAAAAPTSRPGDGEVRADRLQLGDEPQAVGRTVEPGGVPVGGSAGHCGRGPP